MAPLPQLFTEGLHLPVASLRVFSVIPLALVQPLQGYLPHHFQMTEWRQERDGCVWLTGIGWAPFLGPLLGAELQTLSP